MIKAIVFDCDGVILETVEVKAISYGKLVEEYGPEASEMLMAYHRVNGGVSRYPKIAWFYREFLGREVTPEESEALGERFAKSVLDEVMKAPFVPGAREFITAHHQDYPLYVASGTPEEELLDVFERRELTRFFRGLYGSPTTKPAILKRVLEREGLGAKELLFVGDSPKDLEAAKAVGTQFLGRGRFDAPWPWMDDLTGLEAHLRSLA
jgi:HAD superfamily hydrolase (TIGR01509 family)